MNMDILIMGLGASIVWLALLIDSLQAKKEVRTNGTLH